MYNAEYTGRFKKDIKILKKRNFEIEKIKEAIKIILDTGTLPTDKYKTHQLIGNYKGYLEAHIKPDWLIIWKLTEDTVTFIRTGTHSDLF